MIVLKKAELQAVLLTIASYSIETKELVSGLLWEKLTLGAKRRLQKIHKKVQAAYQEFLTDLNLIREECKDDKERMEKEAQILLDETVNIDEEEIQMVEIEEISTSHVYDFTIIEKIAI